MKTIAKIVGRIVYLLARNYVFSKSDIEYLFDGLDVTFSELGEGKVPDNE